MNGYKHIMLALLLTLVYNLSLGQGSPRSLAAIAQKYQAYVAPMQVGFGMLTRKGNKLESVGMGSFDFDENTVFNIGSGTKAFTAILLLQEAERGNLSLTDSIGQYLSPIKNVDGSLTIKTLLQHESGLGELVGKEYETMFFTHQDSIYRTDFLERIPARDTSMIGKFDYCNTNYILLGYLLEKVTDQSYFDLLQERIFKPCGMDHTYPYVSRSLPGLAPPTHNGEEVSQHLDYRFFAHYAFSAGSIASTLADMERYYAHLFTRETLLKPASLEAMLAVSKDDYGLGIMKKEFGGTTYYGHGGNNMGYAYRDYYNPETGELAMYFVNSARIPFSKLLKQELLSYVEGVEGTPAFRKDNVAMFEAYAGKYVLADIGLEFELKSKAGEMYLAIQGAELLLVSQEDDILFDAEFGVEIEVQAETPEVLNFRQGPMATTASRQGAE